MYRNVVSYRKNGKEMIWETTWDADGNRIELNTPIKPYLYFEDRTFTKAKAKSMFGKPLRYLEFESSYDRKRWIDENKNIRLFEKLSPAKQYLLDKYYGKERSQEFMKYEFRIFFFDIEVQIEDRFPEADAADYPINVISIYDTLSKEIHVWTYRKEIDKVLTAEKIDTIKKEIQDEFENIPIFIYSYDDEYKLLLDFIKYWRANCPDVISGWNIDGFDITYIINRINKLFSIRKDLLRNPTSNEDWQPAFELSPLNWNKFAIKTVEEMQLRRRVAKYKILGISICDYINIYKKFESQSEQSWKLDYIANKELNKGKLDYYDLGYDSLKEFMNADFPTFVKYNIIDTILVRQLDIKLNFITLMRRICNIGLVEYESIFKSIPYILGALCIEARNRGMKFLTDSNKESTGDDSQGFEGAFVFPTYAGFYENGIMSFDFNSLYPNCIMTVNMSPETMIGKIESEIGEGSMDKVVIKKPNNEYVEIDKDKLKELLKTKCSISANNVLFKKSTVQVGIIPSFLDELYKGRISIKNKMKQNKKKIKEISDRIKELEAQL